MPSVSYRRKVRYSDTDPQGIVFNANYLVYVDDALTDFFEQVGLPHDTMASKGVEPVVAHAECDFRSAGRIGETLVTTVQAGDFGRTSLRFDFEITEETSARLVASGHEVYVTLDAETGRPVPLPSFIREAFSE
ncbi:MAG: acyl-CoA thioesterase [Acidimicrobiia bacterium]